MSNFATETAYYINLMKKFILNFVVKHNEKLGDRFGLLKLTPADNSPLPPAVAGQFVQVGVDGSKNTFLRRPISINFIDHDTNEIWLLIRNAGEGTDHLLSLKPGEAVNMVMPLGNGFPTDDATGRVLLAGGGVGIAPLLYLGKVLKDKGVDVNYLIGARSERELLMTDLLEKYGPVNISTDDGSKGDPGLVTENHVWGEKWDRIYCCGPAPMMKGVARKARQNSTECYVSLENMMACGVGACLCCVEKTVKGNVCVCTEGPVFEINQLTWQD